MDKISVFPEKVRIGENTLQSKDTTDFELVEATLTKSSIVIDQVSRDIFYLQASASGILAVSVSPSTITVGGDFAVTVSAVDRTSAAISDLDVTLTIGNSSYTVTTGSDGTYTLNVYNYITATGNIAISASATGYNTATTSITVNKHSSEVTMSIASSTVAVGGTFSLSGTVKIDNVLTSGCDVDLYQDGTKIATLETESSTGAWYATVSATTVGTTKFQAFYNGSSTINSSQTNEYTCTVSAISSNLNITVPVLVYQDNFSVTGVLKDGSNNALSGKSVKLYMEHNGTSSLQATQTTDSNGEVTFARTAPTTITTYKFWLEFDGDSTYSNCTSSVEERTVQKETTAFTSVLPANNSQYTVGDNVTISGVLVSDDVTPELISGKNIRVMENNNVLASTTTGNDGSFSMTLQNLAAGTHSLYITFQGDTYYNYVIISRNIVIQDVATVSTVSLTSNKSILSYADSEYATLTATALTSQNVGVPGQSVMFYSGNPTVITNDCTSSTDFTTFNGSPTFAQTGMTIHEDSDRVYLDENVFDLLTGSYEVTITCTKPTGSSSWYGGGIVDSSGVMDYDTGVFVDEAGVTFMDSTFTTPSGLGDTIEITLEITPSTQKIYINDSLVGTTTIDYTQEAGGIPVFDTYNYLGFWKLSGDFEVNNIIITDSGSASFVAYGTTDSNGVATVTYTSQGIGDINIQAKCGSILSGSYEIIDYKLYDMASSTNVSKYTANGSTSITYDSTNNAYLLTNSSNDTVSTITRNTDRFDTDVTIQADIMLIDSISNIQAGIGLLNNNTGASAKFIWANPIWYGMTVVENTRTTYGTNEVTKELNSSIIQKNIWYTLKVVYNGSDITFTLYNGTTVVDTITTTKSVLGSSNELCLLIGNDSGAKALIKNISVM